MIPTEFLREVVSREIEHVENRGILLDLFYRILKEDGKSYSQVRAAWFKYDRKQLHLFEENHLYS